MISVIRIGISFSYKGDFHCYVPENLSKGHYVKWIITNPLAAIQTEELPAQYLKLYTTGYALQTKDNTTFYVTASNDAKLEEYKGEYIILTLQWHSSDDEYGYERTITNIEVNNNQTLGSYPKGMWCDVYYQRPLLNYIEFIGLIGIVPLIVVLLRNMKK
jgi:hypothetical protein